MTRRITQILAEVPYSPSSRARRVTQLLVEIAYDHVKPIYTSNVMFGDLSTDGIFTYSVQFGDLPTDGIFTSGVSYV